MSDPVAGWQPRPAWLFCPADRPDRYPKALAAADVVIPDLEDAVAPGRKSAARLSLRQLARDGILNLQRTVVRINGADSAEHEADVRLTRELSLPRVVLSKAEHPHDLKPLQCDVIPLAETARAVKWARALAEAQNVLGLMRSRRGPVRACPCADRGKACGLLAIDALHMDIAGVKGLKEECEDAVSSGFDATAAIHPSQVAVIRSAYRAPVQQVNWARRLLLYASEDRGVTTFEGRMVDGPIFKQAERLLRLASVTGASAETTGPCEMEH